MGEGITMCDAASVTTRPEFQIKRTPLFLSLPPPPPFSQIRSLSPPLSDLHPTLRHLFFFFSLSFPLYKVFQNYHLYIMTYGYDNVLYYGKMRDLFLLRFVS